MADACPTADWQRRGQLIATRIYDDVRPDGVEVDAVGNLALASAALLGAAETLCDLGCDGGMNASVECRALLASLRPVVTEAVARMTFHWAHTMPAGRTTAIRLAYEAARDLTYNVARRTGRVEGKPIAPTFECAFAVFNGAAITFAGGVQGAGLRALSQPLVADTLGIAPRDALRMIDLIRHPVELATHFVEALERAGRDEGKKYRTALRQSGLHKRRRQTLE